VNGLPRAIACFTFDNMGEAADIGAGELDVRGSDPSLAIGYPRILDMLDRVGVHATFFIEGWNGVHHPAEVRHLVDRGHEIGMHGWMHEDWKQLDAQTERHLAAESTSALAEAAGRAVRGFRAPGGSRSASTEDILVDLGYRFDASLGDAMRPAVLPSGLAQVPFGWPGVDGAYYLRDDPMDPESVEERWTRALERTIEQGGLFMIVAHAFISGVVPERLAVLDRLIRRAVAADELAVMSATEIADVLLDSRT